MKKLKTAWRQYYRSRSSYNKPSAHHGSGRGWSASNFPAILSGYLLFLLFTYEPLPRNRLRFWISRGSLTLHWQILTYNELCKSDRVQSKSGSFLLSACMNSEESGNWVQFHEPRGRRGEQPPQNKISSTMLGPAKSSLELWAWPIYSIQCNKKNSKPTIKC